MMPSQSVRPLSFKEERDAKLAFELFDITGKGEISKEDASKAMLILGYKLVKEDT